MIVIGLVGPKRSGKDTVAEYIVQKYGAKSHAHSEIYNEILRLLKISNTRMNIIKLVGLRDVFGSNVLIHALNKKIQEDKAELEVVTGIRFENELENIKTYPQSILIYIDAPVEQRYERQLLEKQYQGDSTMSFEEFKEIEAKQPTETHIAELKKKCEYILLNDKGREELFEQVDNILERHEIKLKNKI